MAMYHKEAVRTENAPPPMPFWSQAIKCGGMIYVSGNIGLDPKTYTLVEGGVTERAAQAIRNIEAVLQAGGSSLRSVVKVNIFLTTMDNFAALNKAYDSFFNEDPKPCRTCVAVKELPMGTDVEIECTAHLGEVSKL